MFIAQSVSNQSIAQGMVLVNQKKTDVKMVTEINLKIDESILLALNKSKDEFTKEMLFNNASTLYRGGKLNLLKAAELAGCSKTNFISKLKEESGQRMENDEETDSYFFENLQKALRL